MGVFLLNPSIYLVGKGGGAKGSLGPEFAHFVIIPPQTQFVGAYTVFTLSDCPCVHYVLFPSYLEESLTEFHKTLQTHSYVQGKYY